MITLENTKRQSFPIELRHPAFYRAGWGYRRGTVHVVDQNPRTGEKQAREIKKMFPGTLTLLGRNPRRPWRNRIKDLPDEILLVPDVARLRKKGWVKVIQQEAPVAEAAGDGDAGNGDAGAGDGDAGAEGSSDEPGTAAAPTEAASASPPVPPKARRRRGSRESPTDEG